MLQHLHLPSMMESVIAAKWFWLFLVPFVCSWTGPQHAEPAVQASAARGLLVKKTKKLCYSSPVHFTCLEINRLVVDKKRVNAWLEKQSVTRLCFAFKSSLARWNGWKFSQVQCPWFALNFIRQSPNIVTTRSQASARSPEPQIGHYEGRGLLNEHADRCSRHFAT